MPWDAVIVIILLAGVLASFIFEFIEPDVVALSVIAVLMVTGILTPAEGISGFSNPATITILALFFVSKALQRTGITRSIGTILLRVSGRSLIANVVIIVCTTAMASAFINTTAVVVVFLPVVMSISKAKGISPTLLLMPLSFGAIIGGSSTTIGTSTNLLISDAAVHAGLESLNIFEFTWIGAILFAVIVPYMAISSRFILRDRKSEENLVEGYGIKNYLTEIKLEEGCPWSGMKISDIEAIRLFEIDIIEIVREERRILDFYPETKLFESDILLVRINAGNLVRLQDVPGIAFYEKKVWGDRDLKQRGLTLMEMLISSSSSLIGMTIPEINFMEKYNSNVLGLISRRPKLNPKRMKETELRFGDTLLVETRDKNKKIFYENEDFIVLQELKTPRINRRKGWLAGVTVLAVIILAATGTLPILVAVIAGVSLLFLTGCLNINDAYNAVEWKIIFLLAGLIPLGLALEKTGLSHMLADGLAASVNGLPTFWALFFLYMVTTLITSVFYNNATAVIMAPVMISLAPTLGVGTDTMLALTMFAANCCFLTPIGYQTNLLVYGPGRYRFTDFLIIGGPLCVILALICSLVVMVL